MSSLGGPGCSFFKHLDQIWATSIPCEMPCVEMLSPSVMHVADTFYCSSLLNPMFQLFMKNSVVHRFFVCKIV